MATTNLRTQHDYLSVRVTFASKNYVTMTWNRSGMKLSGSGADWIAHGKAIMNAMETPKHLKIGDWHHFVFQWCRIHDYWWLWLRARHMGQRGLPALERLRQASQLFGDNLNNHTRSRMRGPDHRDLDRADVLWVRYSAHLTQVGAYDAVDSYYAHGTLAAGEPWRVVPFKGQGRCQWVVEIGHPIQQTENTNG